MSFVELLQILLPILLSVAGLILLIILIVLGLKILKTIKKIDGIVDEVDDKVKSIKGMFNAIDFLTDKLSFFVDRLIEKFTNWLAKLGKSKEESKEEEK